MGDRNIIYIVFCQVGVVKGLMNDWKDGFEVGAGGNFGDDAAIGSEDVDLGDDDIAQNFGAIFDDGGGSLVAGTFDSQDFHDIYYNIIWTVWWRR